MSVLFEEISRVPGREVINMATQPYRHDMQVRYTLVYCLMQFRNLQED